MLLSGRWCGKRIDRGLGKMNSIHDDKELLLDLQSVASTDLSYGANESASYDPDMAEVLNDLEAQNYRDADICAQRLLDLAREEKSTTKEILAYHIEGNKFCKNKKYVEASASFEKAINVARFSNNHIAQAVIGYDYAAVCAIRHKWQKVYEIFHEIDRVYQELDLVDEKVFSLINLAEFHRVFGNTESALKMLNLARNLHSAFTECASYNNKVLHFLRLKLCQAQLDMKNKKYSEAIELIMTVSPALTEDSPVGIGHGNIKHFHKNILLMLETCYLETRQREKSINNLLHLKKFLESTQDEVFTQKYQVLRAAHELAFENKQQPIEDWIKQINGLWSIGEVEFSLEQCLRLLKYYQDEHISKEFNTINDYYQELLKSLDKKLPREMVQNFYSYYEFTPALTMKTASTYQMKKFVAFSRELICEHNLEHLATKAMELLIEYTAMDRGFVLIFDSDYPQVIHSHKFDQAKVFTERTPENFCLELSKMVLKDGHGFLLGPNFSQDLYHVTKHGKDLIKAINQNSYVILPLVVNGDGIGFVYLDGKGKLNVCRDDDAETLENFASVIAFAISNAYHFKIKENDLKSVKKVLDQHKNELSIQKYSFENFVGISAKNRELFGVLQKTIDSNATITLTGESGVGKEMIAKMIHYNSTRKQEKFVAINCAAIPENLLESELFGYMRGAFTGANENKTGLFLEADGGTLFLDEIGEMPLSMQVKIIRVLQEREVCPIGGNAPKKVDVRIICATNKNLEEMVSVGRFREDLYFRINVVSIVVPSLRDRKEDIPLLADHALRLYALENNVPPKTLSTQAMQFLKGYQWPGNVRELINVMYNLSIFIEKPCIELADLEERKELFRMPIDTVKGNTQNGELDMNAISDQIDKQQLTLSDAKQEFEKLQIQRALKLFNGQITSASYHLQMPRPQVSRLVKKYHLKEVQGDSEDDGDGESKGL